MVVDRTGSVMIRRKRASSYLEQKRKYQRKYRQTHQSQIRNYSRRYRETHLDEILERNRVFKKAHREEIRNYARRNYISSAGFFAKVIGGKREWPSGNKCELCGKNRRKLSYHHWDDNNLRAGMWICPPCHHFAHAFEDESIVRNFINLKAKIDLEMKGV